MSTKVGVVERALNQNPPMQIQTIRLTCRVDKTVFDGEIVVNAPMDVSIASMNAVRCPKCGKHDTLLLGGRLQTDVPGAAAAITDRIYWWRTKGDTGISSGTIFFVLAPAGTGDANIYNGDFDVPHDPADFSRCRQLLDLIPEWKPELHRVAEKFPEWGPMVEQWDKMCRLYDEEVTTGQCPKLYALMQKLIRKGEKARRK